MASSGPPALGENCRLRGELQQKDVTLAEKDEEIQALRELVEVAKAVSTASNANVVAAEKWNKELAARNKELTDCIEPLRRLVTR
jgi:hypothetical protein